MNVINQVLKKRPSKPLKQIVHLRVLDLNTWKGIKFGYGFAIGVAGALVTLSALNFLFDMFIRGFLAGSIPV
jgi:hypothetical protein